MPSLVCSQFSSSTLKQMRTFRENHFLCDVRLVTDGRQEFAAHRLILSAASSFFRELFRSKTDSYDVSTVHLRNCSGECVRAVLHFLYSGELQLQNCDPSKVLNIAKACKIADLQHLLAAYDDYQSTDVVESTKNHRKSAQPKVELDRENHREIVEEPSAKKSKRSCGDFLQKFCQIHSLIGCDCCFSSENKMSPDVFVPSQNSSSLDQYKTSSPLYVSSSNAEEKCKKFVKNTGVNANFCDESNEEMESFNKHSDLASVQIPDDDKEGWCRNKKYIKKTPTGYQCTVCKKTYGRYNSVSYHVTIYHRNPPIQCDQIGCTFSTREARYIHFHKYYRHDIPLPTTIDLESRRCPFCKHVAKSPAMLEKHISRHLPNNATKSSNKYNNNNNKRQSLSSSAEHAPTSRKNNEKKSKCCDKCSYKCTTDGNLQQHKMFKHGGDLWRKNYHCDECTYSSPSQFNLLSHKRRLHDLSKKDDQCLSSDGVISDEDSSTVLKNQPTAPPPSYCSSDSPNSEMDLGSSVSSTTGFVTAVTDLPPSSIVNYGIV